MSEDNKKKNVKIKINSDLEAGVYANAASVSFTNTEVVLDLAYRINNGDDTTIKIVSRVNMTHQTAESFLKVLSNALLDYKNKAEKKDK